MAVTLRLMDGSTTTTEPVSGATCKQHLVNTGVMSGPPETWQVVTEANANVDNEPIQAFDGKKLMIVATKAPGGRAA